MLRISGPGWAEVSIEGKVVFEGSYLTDMPSDFMKALYDFLNQDKIDSRSSSSVYVNGEGEISNLIFTYVLDEPKVIQLYSHDGENDWETTVFDVDINQLTSELINDIESDFENWVNWNAFNDNKDEYRNELTYWLNKLKNEIKR